MQFLRRARSGTLQLGGGPAYGIQHSAEEDVLFCSESMLVFKKVNTFFSQMPSNLETWKIPWVTFFVDLQGHNLITDIKDVYVV